VYKRQTLTSKAKTKRRQRTRKAPPTPARTKRDPAAPARVKKARPATRAITRPKATRVKKVPAGAAP